MTLIQIDAADYMKFREESQKTGVPMSRLITRVLHAPPKEVEIIKEVPKEVEVIKEVPKEVEVIKYACWACDQAFNRIRDVNYHYTVVHEKKLSPKNI